MAMKNILEISGYRRVYKKLASFGDGGGTVYQLSKALNIERHSTVRAQLQNLCREGYVRVSGVTGDSSRVGGASREPVDVYEITEKK